LIIFLGKQTFGTALLGIPFFIGAMALGGNYMFGDLLQCSVGFGNGRYFIKGTNYWT